MFSSQEKYFSIINKLHNFRNYINRNEFYIQFLRALTVFAVVAITVFSLESILNLDVKERTFLFLGLMFLSFMVFIFFVVLPLGKVFGFWKKISDEEIALFVGNHYPEIKDKLVDAIQVYNKITRLQDYKITRLENYSIELGYGALIEISKQIEPIDFKNIVDTSALKKTFVQTFIVIITFLGAFFSSQDIRLAGYRVFHPFKDFAPPAKFGFNVEPGNIKLLRGSDIKIKIKAFGEFPDKINFTWKEAEWENYEQKVLKISSDGITSEEIKSLKSSLEYFISAKNVKTEHFFVEIINPPTIRNLDVKLFYPQYTGLGTKYLEPNIGDVNALKGTKISVSVYSDKDLNSAEIVFSDSSGVKMKVNGRKSTGTFTLIKNGKYRIELKDNENISNVEPIEYRLNVIPDEFPTVKIIEPRGDVEIGESMIVPISAIAKDDFGFSDVNLKYTKEYFATSEFQNKIQWKSIPIKFLDLTELQIQFNWNTSSLGFLPEDIITYYIEVYDNDEVSGPKVAQSEIFNIRFPSLMEIFSRLDEHTEENIKDIKDIVDESKELKEKLEDISKDLRKESELNWEKKKSIEDVLKRQEELQKKIDQINQDVQQMIEEVEKNNLLDKETLQKYSELQQLLNEIATPELKKAMEELNRAVEKNVSPEQMKKALDNFKFSQEAFKKSVERTLELLRRLQIEQKMDEVAKRAEELLKRQEAVNQELPKSEANTERNELAKREEKLSRDTENLKKELQELQQKMSDDPLMPTKEIGESQEFMERKDISGEMEEMGENITNGRIQEAGKQGENIKQSLSELSDMLRSAQKKMKQNQKQDVMDQMQKMTDEMIFLSQRQEALANQSRMLNPASPQLGEVADRQLDLSIGLGKVADDMLELSKKTFFVSPEMGKALGKAMTKMGSALSNLESRNGYGASQEQIGAMAGLNEAIMAMQSAMGNLGSSESGLGFEEYLRQLQQMAGMQSGINNETMNLNLGQGGQGDGLTMEQRAGMQRLAAQQQALKEALDKLNEQMGKRSDVLGRLDEVANEMEEVAQDLQSKNIDKKTLERQQRILSRLLDAQKSIREQDYGRKRESKTGKDYIIRSPKELPKDLGEKKNKLHQDLLKALEEGYSKDYEEIIKKYFEALGNIEK